MARIDNLNNFLTDVADSIRTKKGTTDLISPSNFDTEIESIETGGGDISEYFNIPNLNGSNSANSSVGGWIHGIKKMQIKDHTITNCQYLFSKYKGEELEFINVDTSSTTSMMYMFNECSNLKTLDLSGIDASNVTTMNYMISYCLVLTSVNLEGFNTSKCTNFQSMFYGSRLIGSLNINHFDVSKATNMGSMFSSCMKLEELDLSNWETPALTNTNSMFQSCSALKRIDMRNFDFTNVTSYSGMFTSVPANCLIIVKDDTQKTWITGKFKNLTNVKTVAEYESGN